MFQHKKNQFLKFKIIDLESVSWERSGKGRVRIRTNCLCLLVNHSINPKLQEAIEISYFLSFSPLTPPPLLPYLSKYDWCTGGQDLIEVGHPSSADGTDPRQDGLSVLHLGPVGAGKQVATDDQLRQEFAYKVDNGKITLILCRVIV